MTQKEKQLLLEDLCARLFYGVKIFHEIIDETGNTHTYDGYILYELANNGQHITLLNRDDKHGVCEVDIECGVFKPYLRSMSSMTDEEEIEYDATFATIKLADGRYDSTMTYKSFDFLNAHHFDFRGLIEKGLALEVPEGMYNTK